MPGLPTFHARSSANLLFLNEKHPIFRTQTLKNRFTHTPNAIYHRPRIGKERFQSIEDDRPCSKRKERTQRAGRYSQFPAILARSTKRQVFSLLDGSKESDPAASSQHLGIDKALYLIFSWARTMSCDSGFCLHA